MMRILSVLLSALVLLGAGSGCSAKAKKARHLQRAEKFYQAGQYAKAEIEYLNVLKFSPPDERAVAQLGALYYDQGRLMRSLAYLEHACKAADADPELQYRLGTISLAGDNTKKARELALRILEKVPSHSEAPVLLAETAGKADLAEIRQRLEKLAPAGNAAAPYHAAYGVLDLKAGDLPSALAAFKRALELDPKLSIAHFALGNLAWAQNDLKTAEAELKAGAELVPPRSVRRIGYIDFKLKTGDLAEGKRLLEEISKQSPDYIPAWIKQAELALAATNFTECASLLNQALARDTGNMEATLLKAGLFMAQKQPEKAIAELDRLNRNYQERLPNVLYQLALAHLQNKDKSNAYKCLAKAAPLNRCPLEATLLLARFEIERDHAEVAVASLTELLKKFPRHPQVHLLLAEAWLSGKKPNYAEATTVYRRMSGLFPKSAQVPLLLGTVLFRQNKLPEARQAFNKALELAPDYLPATAQLIDLDIAEKKFSSALERAEGLLKKKPDTVQAHLVVAQVHLAEARDILRRDSGSGSSPTNLVFASVPAAQQAAGRGEAMLLKAIELEPTAPSAYTLLAQLYVQSGKHQQALERLTPLISSTNVVTQMSALAQVGVIQDELKDYVAARAAYEKMLTVSSNSLLALNNLAYLYCERLGELDKAYELASRARQLSPALAHSADTLGWVLYKKGDYARALPLLQEAALHLGTESEVQFHLGMTQYMLGDEGPARSALQQALQGNQDFVGKEEGQRRLALLTMDVDTTDAALVAQLEKQVREQPQDPIAAARLAAIYERDRATDKAVDLYERILKQSPRNIRVMARLAQIYAERPNDRVKALELAKTAHTIDEEDAEVSYLLGKLVYQEKDYQRAFSLLQDAARKLPDRGDLLFDLAWANYRLGRVRDAETAMHSALQARVGLKNQEPAKQFLTVVQASGSAAKAKAALPQAQQLLSTDPGYLPALMVSALALEQDGKFDEAKKLYEQMLSANPQFEIATRNLALLCVNHLGDDAKGYDLALKARTAFPDDPEVARALGIAAFRKGDYNRAAQLLGELARKAADDAERFYYLGMAHYKLKQNSQSKDALQRALALNIGTKLADDARKVLAEIK